MGLVIDLDQTSWWAVEMEENIMKDILEVDAVGPVGVVGCRGRMKCEGILLVSGLSILSR